MTKKEFARRILNGEKDSLQEFLDSLGRRRIRFCVIGGLAVNAYADPVVSVDLDVVVAAGSMEELRKLLRPGCKVREFANSLNIPYPGSDLKIQVHTDLRYQAFLPKARTKDVLGYQMPMVAVRDVLQGKIWAARDEARRPSKRQKDLADILRLLEKRPGLAELPPPRL
jgi:hypothetical protein